MEKRDLSYYQELIKSSQACLFYFYTNQCTPCAELRPKVKSLTDAKYPLMKTEFIAADTANEMSSRYNVFASPTIILFFDGKETRRFSKFVSIDEIDRSIDRYYSLIFE